MNILIADDSPVTREGLISVLSEVEGVGFIREAGDAEEAISAIRQTKPDLVVLDVRMPGGGGLEVLRKTRNLPEPPVIVMFTNYAYPQLAERCLELGAGYFLDKARGIEKIAEIAEGLSTGSLRGNDRPGGRS